MYQIDSNLNDSKNIFLKILDADSPLLNPQARILNASYIDTILGPMIAIADERELYLLEFYTKRRLDREIQRLKRHGFVLNSGVTAPLISIELELKAYFKGELTEFKTPYCLGGSLFQQEVWKALSEIPYGITRSYAEQASLIGRPTAYRAVANANGANQLSIIVPCHRIISSDGSLGGYGGGVEIKQWLLEHEQRHLHKKA